MERVLGKMHYKREGRERVGKKARSCRLEIISTEVVGERANFVVSMNGEGRKAIAVQKSTALLSTPNAATSVYSEP